MLTFLLTRCLPVFAVFMLSGCANLFVQGGTDNRAGFAGFDDVRARFDQVEPGKTDVKGLSALGFDQAKTTNIRRLSYPELMTIFLPNPSVRMQDQAPEVRRCFAKREHCYGLQLRPEEIRSKRVGSLLLDVFGFRRETHINSWYFSALFVMQDDTVVYKLWSGESNTFRKELQKNPLGPLQNITPQINVGD